VSPSGLVCVDKPVGPTSHDVVARIRRMAGIRRAGHAGTLDPLASGLLLVCVGRATRLVEYLVGLDKIYETTIRLGQSTTTYDAEGELTAERPVIVGASEIAHTLLSFRGSVRQRVPPFSAVKQGGQPLYKKARSGQEFDLPEREVTIHALEMLAYEEPQLTLRITSSSGVYVRSLAHDLGEALGCGGHVVALRRTAVGHFSLAQTVRLDALTSENFTDYLLPPQAAVAHLSRVEFDEPSAIALGHGQRIAAPVDAPVGEVAAFGPGGRFLGIVAAENGWWRPKKMILDEETN
jgi:tRNA pseudouridine55 synthase